MGAQPENVMMRTARHTSKGRTKQQNSGWVLHGSLAIQAHTQLKRHMQLNLQGSMLRSVTRDSTRGISGRSSLHCHEIFIAAIVQSQQVAFAHAQ